MGPCWRARGPGPSHHGRSARRGWPAHPLTCCFPLTVSQPQAAPSPPEKPPGTAILCGTCGNVCRGEVLRVQDKYFHIECFVCKGERAGLCPCPVRRPQGQASSCIPGELARESRIPEDPECSLHTAAWPVSLTGVTQESGSEDGAQAPGSVLVQPRPASEGSGPVARAKRPLEPWSRKVLAGGMTPTVWAHRTYVGPRSGPPAQSRTRT